MTPSEHVRVAWVCYMIKTHNRDLSAEVILDLTILDSIRSVLIDHGGKLCKKSISLNS